MTLVWMVTGVSTGLGRAIALAALVRGDAVVAAVRDPGSVADLVDAYPDSAVAVPMDVTDPDAVRDGVAAAVGRWGRIDVLVNNAGRGLLGAVEEPTDAQIRALLEVNVFGLIAVTRAVLPHMRERGSGHVVQLSSVGGVVANPGHAFYAASKFAVEGLSEALAGEVAGFGIRVTIVEPGPFRTDFAGRSLGLAEPMDAYAGTPAAALRASLQGQDRTQPGDPHLAAVAILRCVDDPTAPLRLPLGDRALDRIRTKLTAQLADLEAWAEISAATAYTRP